MHKRGFNHLWLVAFILTFIGCDSSSTKNLTESTAQSMLKSELSKAFFPLNITAVNNLAKPTRTDYKTLEGKGDDLVYHQLLELGILDQHTNLLSYPNVSGTFTGEWKTSDPKTNCNNKNQYSLTMDSGSNTFSGTQVMFNCAGEEASRSHVTGSVDENGGFHVTSGFGWWNGKFIVDGTNATLTLPGPWYMGPEWKITGPASPQKVNVNWYTYSLSPDGEKQVKREAQSIQLNSGTYTIGEVTNLRLVTETQAVANFAWTVSLNKAGKALFENAKPHGLGEVAFNKKPDGSWVIAEWNAGGTQL